MRWFEVEGLILAAMSDDGSEAYGWFRDTKSWEPIRPREILNCMDSPEISMEEANASALARGANLKKLPIKF